MTAYPPRGLVIALVTPCNEKKEIDWASFKNLAMHTLPFGDSLLIGEGMIGEGIYLSNKQRLELAQGAIEIIASRKPLFLCLTADTALETKANIEEVSKKYSSLVEKGLIYFVDLPLWYHSNRHLPQFYETLGQYALGQIILYNNPLLISTQKKPWKRKNIRTNILKRLAEKEQMRGLINLSDLKRALNYQRAVRLRREFRIYDGDERKFLEQPSSAGVVSAGANLFPEDWKEVVSASLHLSEDPGQNFLLWKKSEKLKKFYQAYHNDPAKNLKFALFHRGIIAHPQTFGGESALALTGDKEMVQFLKENFSGSEAL